LGDTFWLFQLALSISFLPTKMRNYLIYSAIVNNFSKAETSICGPVRTANTKIKAL